MRPHSASRTILPHQAHQLPEAEAISTDPGTPIRARESQSELGNPDAITREFQCDLGNPNLITGESQCDPANLNLITRESQSDHKGISM